MGSHGIDITQASYGKSELRVLLFDPAPASPADSRPPLDLILTIDVTGDFDASFQSGDNRRILPSDTFRRHALAACASTASRDTGDIVAAVAQRVLAANGTHTSVTVTGSERGWRARGAHSYVGEGSEHVTTTVVAAAAGQAWSGAVHGLELLTTTGSAFTGFLRDELTVQDDAVDRPLCGRLDASWTLTGDHIASPVVAARLVAAVADRPSNAVQELLHRAGRIVLDELGPIESLSLRFDSLPITMVNVAGVARRADATSVAELSAGPVGVTSVTLRRT